MQELELIMKIFPAGLYKPLANPAIAKCAIIFTFTLELGKKYRLMDGWADIWI